VDAVLDRFPSLLGVAFEAEDARLADKPPERANVAALQALYRSIAAGDLGQIEGLLTDDIVFELFGPSNPPYVMEARGKTAALAGIGQNFQSSEWSGVTVETLVAQGDLVVVIGTETGRFRHNGVSFANQLVLEYRFRDGRVARHRGWAWPLPVERPLPPSG